jgi:hypothetical protein
MRLLKTKTVPQGCPDEVPKLFRKFVCLLACISLHLSGFGHSFLLTMIKDDDVRIPLCAQLSIALSIE